MAETNFDQIILVDKPAGISSFGVVAKVRYWLKCQAGHKVKVGHCGTLDPFATGLLILVTGKFTRRAVEFSGLDKEYIATIKLGATSSTGDPEGEITVQPVDNPPDIDVVQQVLDSFIGQIKQTPPVYSAIKVNGQRAYKLARAGKDVTMSSRSVTIHELKLVSYSYPELRIATKVSSGTYIRSLAVDIGQALSTGAYVTDLRRTKIGSYTVEQAKQLTEFETAAE